MSFLSDNGGPIAVGAAVIIALGAYIELRLPSVVSDEVKTQTDQRLEAIHNVSPDKIEAMESDIENLEEGAGRLDDKITRIIDILLEE